jgi:hypothetical protein
MNDWLKVIMGIPSSAPKTTSLGSVVVLSEASLLELQQPPWAGEEV